MQLMSFPFLGVGWPHHTCTCEYRACIFRCAFCDRHRKINCCLSILSSLCILRFLALRLHQNCANAIPTAFIFIFETIFGCARCVEYCRCSSSIVKNAWYECVCIHCMVKRKRVDCLASGCYCSERWLFSENCAQVYLALFVVHSCV